MPPRLSQAQQYVAKHLLYHNTLHITIANIIKCSVVKVSSNLLKYGMLYKFKSSPKGKLKAVTFATIQLCFYVIIFIVKKVLMLKGIKK